MQTSIFLSPGMFGFAKVASYAYFEHVVTALERRFMLRGRSARVTICDVHPTASVRRRATKLCRVVHDTAGQGRGPIHIVGHSTGGLDARLVASPSVHLPGITQAELAWLPRLTSITMMNTPHFGTPLAAFFATKSGQQVLYAVSALTVTGLKLGAPPLAAASALMAAFGRLSGAIELEVLERTSESIIKVLDDAGSRDLRSFLRLIREDQGSVIQLTPEAMDLFQASVEDCPGVRYQSVASYAPRESTVSKLLGAVASPWSLVSAAIFTALYNITSRHDERYPCNDRTPQQERAVRTLLGSLPAATENDGVVPFYSQLWGDVVWVGKGDHLDIVGHFPGKKGSNPRHVDWLRSWSGFDETRFETVMDRIFEGMLLAEESRTSAP
jgi:triacylglycerol lipase